MNDCHDMLSVECGYVDVECCDDIYEAIRFNESQECYQDQQPAADWDAVMP